MSAIATFARDELGLTLTPAQDEMVTSFESGGFSQAVWQCGRRGGKSLNSDVLALYDATARDHLRSKLRPGEPRVSGIVAPRQQQADAHIANCRALLDHSPRLRKLLVAETGDSLTFANGSVIAAFPCSARSIRGGAWSSAILDEIAHMSTIEEGNAASDRIYEAVLPAGAQFGPDAWLVAISTPLWRQGAFWKLVQRATSGRFGHIHYRHLTTAEMNPNIDRDWLEERRREDPDLYAREFLAEFIDGIGAYLSAPDVLACVRAEPMIRQPAGHRYVAALDPAFSHDDFALAVGHEEDGNTVIDGVWSWRREGYEATLDQVAGIAKRYGIRRLRTDQHAPVPIQEGLRKRHLEADYQAWTNQTKSDAFSALKVALNTHSIELPNDPKLIEELCQLEARPTQGGYTRIAAAGGGHDDRAVVVAAVVSEFEGADAGPIVLTRYDYSDPDPDDPDPVRTWHWLAAAGGADSSRPFYEGPCRHENVAGFRCANCGAERQLMTDDEAADRMDLIRLSRAIAS